MKHVPKNDKGENISGKRKVSNKKYCKGYAVNGEPIINWDFLSKYADNNGFDVRNLEENGYYMIEIELPIGTEIIRYGNESGRFTAPNGTKYEDLALPYDKESVEFNQYRVISSPLKVVCKVKKGRVAPGFDSQGGAIQFLHDKNILQLRKEYVLERIANGD